MKKLQHYIWATLLLLVMGCSNRAQTTADTIQESIKDTTIQDNDSVGIRIDFDETAVIRNVYVVDRKGAAVKQQPEKNAKSLGHYDFGERLDVIEETTAWLGIRDRITRNFSKNGSQIESTGWEKVYVLKSQTGAIDEISLIPEDLPIISLLTANQKTESYEKGKPLSAYIELELIDKALFESKKNTAVDFLLADTLASKKKNGIIELTCQNKTVKYVDKPDAEVDEQLFSYLGQIPFLNQYLIAGVYWEAQDYKFIDKASGDETTTFTAYPYISADKEHIIGIFANPYEGTADLELYTIVAGKVEMLMGASFTNWMPNVESDKMFWSADGYFYTAVTHVAAFWNSEGHLNEQCQYMRIKVL